MEEYTIRKPVLLITSARDPIAIPNLIENTTRELVPDLRVGNVNAGHWAHLEARDSVNLYLEVFFDEVIQKS